VAQQDLDQLLDDSNVVGGAANDVVAGVGKLVSVVVLEGFTVTLDKRVVNNHIDRDAIGLHTVNIHTLELKEALWPVNMEEVAKVEGE
jgi:hypothetical protein